MRTKPTLTLAILCTLFHLASCESDSDIIPSDVGGQPVLVALAYPDGILDVQIYASVSYADTALFKDLQNDIQVDVAYAYDHHATQTIPRGQTNVKFSNLGLDPGTRFDITATYGETTITASSEVPTVIEAESIDTSTVLVNGTESLAFSFTIADKLNTTDYYQVRIICSSTDSTGTVSTWEPEATYSSYMFFAISSATYIQSHKIIGLFDDNTFQGSTATATMLVERALLTTDGTRPTNVEARLYHHTRDYFKYLLTTSTDNSASLLPVFGSQTVHSNVNGALGIVSGICYSATTFTINQNLITPTNQ